MTHEFKKIIETYAIVQKAGQKTVLATVISVEGSSYRREGARMLVLENGKTIGAISGGCVEKEVVLKAQSVFKSGAAKIMTYDGRYRLGCEGTLYVLLEELVMDDVTLDLIHESFVRRKEFVMKSWFSLGNNELPMGSELLFNSGEAKNLNKHLEPSQQLEVFEEKLEPCFRLVIFGGEHDSAKLCELACATGWEVTVICSPQSGKSKRDFLRASEVILSAPENYDASTIDSETAVVIMSHNFAKDVLFLKALKVSNPIYIGLLGPAKRREQLLHAYIEYHPEVDEAFLDRIYGPAGLNIGAETPNEIGISIIAEILSVVRKENVMSLQDKKGAIHTTRIKENETVEK
ncbi:XdhC family protein [Flavicella sp.]|uniref:XdhC family protein n=1 Tax=Flavicella sp. TaxID=2957742 RepID=UPI002637E48B|nr:XdhC family protein [Flavicella sp.]MDG1805575.1 XdhC family protein [Flavicella sp.]